MLHRRSQVLYFWPPVAAELSPYVPTNAEWRKRKLQVLRRPQRFTPLRGNGSVCANPSGVACKVGH
eukprot:9906641-Lingulodinium_polyedra.AAC.1